MFKSIEVCPLGNEMPRHGALLRGHKPVRTPEEYAAETEGWTPNDSWNEIVATMKNLNAQSYWILVKRDEETNDAG